MAKAKFSATERWAIYNVHGKRCYIGSEPIVDLFDMEIDHIIPESLLDDPEKLKKTLAAFGLPEAFDLNAYENLLPACARCNSQKLAHVFEPGLLIKLALDTAKEKAPVVRSVVNQAINERRLSESLNLVERAIDKQQITPVMMRRLEALAARAKEVQWQVNLRFEFKIDKEGLNREIGVGSRDARMLAAIRLLKAFREISMYRERDGLVYRIPETQEP